MSRMLVATFLLFILTPLQSKAVPLLPDLFSWAVDEPTRMFMYGGTFDLDSEPGVVQYRFNVVIPNIGDGPLMIFEETDLSNGTQDIYQNICFQSECDASGGFDQEFIGTFELEEDPPFGHLHFKDLAHYNLREVMPGMGVGDIVAHKSKTSHGLVDSVAYDTDLPGAPQQRVFSSSNLNPLGVSIGWGDLYGKGIPQQHIDITGVPSGQYWLEVVIDPFNYVQETDDTNNTTRILVDIEVPVPGDYNGNSVVDSADYAVWLGSLGSTTDLSADGNRDDQVTIEDYHFWKERLGNNSLPVGQESASSGSGEVPEPSTLGLLTLWAVLIRYVWRVPRRFVG